MEVVSQHPTRSRIFFLVAIVSFLMCATSRAHAANRYLIDSAVLHASSSLPQTLVDGVNPQGWLLYTQSYGVRDSICEVFLAKTVASQHASADKLPYRVLKPGVFIGIIHLLPEATEDYSADFHNQQLKPGYYTMRYAVMPGGTYEHGTKLGEFLVLAPANMDRDPAQILKLGELARLGSAASGNEVAASMELVAPDRSLRMSPAAKADETGMCIFQVQLRLTPAKGSAPKELPLAIAMLNPLHGPEGS